MSNVVCGSSGIRLTLIVVAALFVSACTSGGGSAAPSGSVIVSGLLHETPPTASTGVAGAKMEVVDGPSRETGGATDDSGHFRLSVVPGANVDLLFTKPGYADAGVQHIAGLQADAVRDVATRPLVNLAVRPKGSE